MNGDAFIAKSVPRARCFISPISGGSGDDAATAVAVDSSGNAYVVGLTTSQNFPLANPLQQNFGGMGGKGFVRTGDAFVAKLNPAGNKLIYSTYLGGNQDDAALAVAIDAQCDAYVAGVTVSMNFPISSNAFLSRRPWGTDQWDPGDVFIAELNPSGSQ